MKILGIESSADESGVSLIEASGDFGADFSFKVLGNAIASQIATHAQYGGIYPNMAVREHQKNFVPLLETVLKEAGYLAQGRINTDLSVTLSRETELRGHLTDFFAKYSKPDGVDAIAVTHGPGLEPTLWVGVNFAKALAAAWNLPLVPVNHMEGHILISAVENGTVAQVQFPLLSLLISGGHTELVLSRDFLQYKLIGQTRDDAVGEAFDKVARLMGLPYPGGPEIDRLAAEARQALHARKHEVSPHVSNGDEVTPHGIALPRPMIDSDDFDFSFSGLKTAVKKVVEANQPLTDDFKKALALEFENACADVLIAKTMRAIEEYDVQTLVVGGGVSANSFIRERLASAIKDYGADTKLLIPPRSLATDNALMIALAGYFRAQRKEFAAPETIRAQGNLKLA